ncbi:MAG: NAD(+) synthase, partial [Verrucomicrobiaceae bacterium]
NGLVPEVCIIELGGTIGDIEGTPFIEALRQLKRRVKKENFCSCHVSMVPCIGLSRELKSKPTQASVIKLRSLGLSPDLIVCRSEVPISDIYHTIKATLKPVFGGKPEDVTEENIQARIRGLLLMALSNKDGHLLLTTGNKSELAVGYCTIYGDMCGGLAVISDLPKIRVYELCRWINREREIIPWNTIDKPPSAELRPDQKDQDTLPPYDILDAILELYVERQLSTDEIISAGYEENLVRWIQRRVDLNEWKRQQAAPGLRVTSKAFGIGRRMPVVQRFIG